MGATISSLCWDCARATGKCRWSASLQPVKGWTVKTIKASGAKPYDTYVVLACPLFERDAVGGGIKRYDPDEPLFRAIKKGKKKNGDNGE